MAQAPGTIGYPPELVGFASIIAIYGNRVRHACRAVASHIPALLTSITFDASIMNCGIFFFPDPALSAREAYRTFKRTGTAVFTLWKNFGFKPIL